MSKGALVWTQGRRKAAGKGGWEFKEITGLF